MVVLPVARSGATQVVLSGRASNPLRFCGAGGGGGAGAGAGGGVGAGAGAGVGAGAGAGGGGGGGGGTGCGAGGGELCGGLCEPLSSPEQPAINTAMATANPPCMRRRCTRSTAGFADAGAVVVCGRKTLG